MLLGKYFKFTVPTTGMQVIDGTARLVTIPAHDRVKIISCPDSSRKLPDKGLVYVLWDGRTVALFAVDVEARGIEVRGPGRGHGHSAGNSATA